MAVTGMVLIQQPHFSSGKLACFIALLNAFFTAISMLGLNQLQNVDPRAVVTHFSGVSSVISLIFLMVATPQIHWPQLANPKALVWLFMVGVTGVIGQMGMTMAFTRGNVSRVSVVGLSQIIFGLGLDLLIWHRHVSLISLIGIMLAASPTAWLMLTRESNQPPQAPPPEDLLANNKLTLPTP